MPLGQADRSPEVAIHARALARRFGARWVLRGASLQVGRGEAVGLLGANGSGKSTLLRTLGTLLRPSLGTAQVCGYDVVREADDVRRHVGFLAHTPGLYDDLSARENLEFAHAMLGRTADAIGVGAALERVGLAAAGDARVRGFSAGMQRRLALARLLLARPTVLLMDEPYSNLDAEGIALMNTVITDAVQRGGAALVVLHELAPAAGMLDRTITLTGGRIAESDATDATEMVAEAAG
jgi:heme exporter protein A